MKIITSIVNLYILAGLRMLLLTMTKFPFICGCILCCNCWRNWAMYDSFQFYSLCKLKLIYVLRNTHKFEIGVKQILWMAMCYEVVVTSEGAFHFRHFSMQGRCFQIATNFSFKQVKVLRVAYLQFGAIIKLALYRALRAHTCKAQNSH